MTEEQDKSTPPPDDARFEVKWSKKSGSSDASRPEIIGQPDDGDLAAVRQQLEEERRRGDELRDKWQRAAADLANFRKRTDQDRADLEKMASMQLVFELLPILDNFERAVATLPKNLETLTWIYGMLLIGRELQATLERRGLKQVEALGKPFDPRFHEAISERETAENPPGTVVQEMQRGYLMHEYLLRPTLVEVARAPAGETGEANVEDESAAQAETTAEEPGVENSSTVVD